MKIAIENEILKKYPNYKMGLIKMVVKEKNWEKLRSLTKFEGTIRDREVTTQEWANVFLDMQANERRLPSVVALWNIIDRFGELKPINYFVDAYNYISVKHGIPMGGYDIEKLPQDELTLQYAILGRSKI